MMRPSFPLLSLTAWGLGALVLRGQTTVELPSVTVYSTRVANQSPISTFAMPVSALRYEPRVDLEGRNFVEGQADVTIRGGIFENTGFRVGGVSILDPQTGHYLAELPIAPAMLGAPEILTGADLTLGVTNATVGAVSYAWRPIRTAGSLQVGLGPHDLRRGEVYQGYVSDAKIGQTKAAADVAIAHSESDGAIAYGDHRFDRVDGRFQLQGEHSQTDFFAGYQAKFFGWPNLYTPFGVNESENLQTLLLAVNHRVDLGAGDYLMASAYHRRNKDNYIYNRTPAPPGQPFPFFHTTWEDGASAEGRRDLGPFTLNARGEVLADYLESSSLNFGHYHSRTLTKLAVAPEKTWASSDGGTVTAKAGMTYDDSNHDEGAVSPFAELSRQFPRSAVRRLWVSYAQTTQEPTYTALNSSATGGLFRGNPNLGRETSQNAEIGAMSTWGGWTTELAGFARHDRALVDWTFRRAATPDQTNRAARYANAMDLDTYGFEAVTRHSSAYVDLVLGYTVLAKTPDYRGAAVDASFYALNYARHRLTAAITARLGHGFELRMDNVARIQAANLLRSTGGDHAVLSTVALAFRPEAWHALELTVQVDNLWNSRFQEIPAVPATPREWSVGASYVW